VEVISEPSRQLSAKSKEEESAISWPCSEQKRPLKLTCGKKTTCDLHNYCVVDLYNGAENMNLHVFTYNSCENTEDFFCFVLWSFPR